MYCVLYLECPLREVILYVALALYSELCLGRYLMCMGINGTAKNVENVSVSFQNIGMLCFQDLLTNQKYQFDKLRQVFVNRTHTAT